MLFSDFIKVNVDAIVDEWETFARTLMPLKGMTALALRNHCRHILLAIAKDMATAQSGSERSEKSRRMTLPFGVPESAASAHGALRHLAGFDLTQMVGEFRALRASVLEMWRRSQPQMDCTEGIEEIARFNEGIDQAIAESVERYSTDVSTFLAVIGHELRSPLWAIQGSIGVLSVPESPEPSRFESLQRIERSVKMMSLLINDLLEYSGSQLGRNLAVRRVDCDMEAICKSAFEIEQTLYPKQEFVLTLSGDLTIKADPIRMQQVLSNLLNNAVHHGTREKPVTLTATGIEGAVVLTVGNAGKPIPSAALQAIFEPLVQVPAPKAEAHQQPYTGLGLGLFIVREIVSHHQGNVSVVSGEATGTVFTVRLPRDVAVLEAPEAGKS